MILSVLLLFHIILESLPVSSSAHLKLIAPTLLIIPEELAVLIHVPTIVVILAYFYRDLWSFFINKRHWIHGMWCLFYVGIADVITCMWYVFFHYYGRDWFAVWFGLAVTGTMLISLRAHYASQKTITWYHALIIGCVQGIALLPGISRLGSTYVVGRWLGLAPITAFSFSWAIEVPLLGAAAAKVIYTNGVGILNLLPNWFWLFLPVAMLGAYCALWLVEWLIMQQRLWLIGIYMLAMSAVTFWFF